MTERTPPPGLPLALVAAERQGAARWVDALLSPNGYAVLLVPSGQQALTRVRTTQPDVIFVEAVLPDMSGLELCRILRDDPRVTHSTPILVTTPHTPTSEQRVAALQAGAWDCVGRGSDPDELLLKADAYVRAKMDADRARAEGLIDPVSGLYNRQGMARRAREIGAQAFRQHGALACVVFVLDLEPAAAAGDAAAAAILRSLQALNTTSRLSDVVGRLGPTEFAVLAPATDEAGAVKLANRLMHVFETAGTDAARRTPLLRVRAGYDAVPNVRYAPIEPVDLLVRASAALRRGQPETGAGWLRRYEEGTGGAPRG